MAGSGRELWGKERVIATLMRAQSESGEVAPRLITFAPCGLAELLSSEGYSVNALGQRDMPIPPLALLALRRRLQEGPPAMLHTHGYKANIIGRIMRASGVPMRGLVSTCHGWVDESARTRLYNRLDRATAFASDVVTVTDRGMLGRLPRGTHGIYVANGIDDRPIASDSESLLARAHFGFPTNRVVVGVLGRADGPKGVLDVLEAARRTSDLPIQWVVAGSGPLEDELSKAALPNFTFLGYRSDSERYLNAIDVYLQASHSEGLSIALLEAMRACVPIIATPVGSTALAVRHLQEAMLVPVADVEGMIAAVRTLMENPELASRLGRSARSRFENAFQVKHQHRAFLDIYGSCDRIRR